MAGNVVYIIMQHLIREHDRQLMGVFATWDGAYMALQRIKKSEEALLYQVRESGYKTADYTMEVLLNGKVVYEYEVYTRELQ